MKRHLFVTTSIWAACLVLATSSNAITILSGPTFTPATNAPLAGTLQLTTDVNSRISIQVSDGSNSWARGFFDYTNNHTVTLLGFKAGRTNQIVVTVHDRLRNTYTATQALNFVTTNLPANFPKSVVWTSIPSQMEPGYTLFLISGVGRYMTMVDNSGQVVWYSPAPSASSYDVRQLSDGNLFTETSSLEEINMLGQVVRVWSPPSGYPVNVHEGDPTAHGTILYLSDVSTSITNFPATVVTNPVLHTVNVDDNPVVEISATNSALLNHWSPITLLNIPTRVTYLTVEQPGAYGVDNIHANAVIESTNDNCLIQSLRNQNCVYKFSRDTGQLKWVLGSPDNWSTNVQPYLLTPVGTPFSWQWGQHAPELTPQGTLLMFDNGIDRANPFNPPWGDQTNFSRAVEYSIDETNMTVTQVWDSTAAGTNVFYSTVMGDADWQPNTQNILVTYAYISYVNGAHPSPYSANAAMSRIVEMTHDPVPQIVFDLAFFDYTNTSPTYAGNYCYRAYRVPDLYAHPVLPVTDLMLSLSNSTALLQFSADPARTNSIQVSTNLMNWSTLAMPQSSNIGEYDFLDPNSSQMGTRFYRVLTQ